MSMSKCIHRRQRADAARCVPAMGPTLSVGPRKTSFSLGLSSIRHKAPDHFLLGSKMCLFQCHLSLKGNTGDEWNLAGGSCRDSAGLSEPSLCRGRLLFAGPYVPEGCSAMDPCGEVLLPTLRGFCRRKKDLLMFQMVETI